VGANGLLARYVFSVEDANASEARIAGRQFISSLGQSPQGYDPAEIKALKAQLISD
jgi:hypothetical protein